MITCLDRLQHWLREQHVGYSIRHHYQALAWENMAAELHENSAHIARTVIAQADGRRVLLVIPVTEQVDFQRVARLLQAQSVVPAREGDFEAGLLDCELDALPPFGSLFHLPTYLDKGLARMNQIVFLAGTHRATIRVATDEYVRAAQPIIGQLTGPHITPGRNGQTKIEPATSTTHTR
jgi:Ala-tRNA(Pro) deacylase